MVEVRPARDLRECHSLLGETETTKGKSFRCWFLLATDILQPGLNLHTLVLSWGLLRPWLLGSFSLSSWLGWGVEDDWNRRPYHCHGICVGENLQWGQDPGLFCALLTEVHRALQGRKDLPLVWLLPSADCGTSMLILHTFAAMPNLRFSRRGSWENKSMGKWEECIGYENGPDFSFHLLGMQGFLYTWMDRSDSLAEIWAFIVLFFASGN